MPAGLSTYIIIVFEVLLKMPSKVKEKAVIIISSHFAFTINYIDLGEDPATRISLRSLRYAIYLI